MESSPWPWLWLLLSVVYSGGRTAHATVDRLSKVDGDIIIGALFPVHRQPPNKVAYTRQCGEIWEQYGMHRIEVFLRTLDQVNADERLLPGVKLGSDIRDSCWYPPVALEQSIDFIKNSIASIEQSERPDTDQQCGKKHDKPIAGLIGPGSSTVTIQVQNLLALFNIPQIGYSSTSKDLSDKALYRYFLRVVPSDSLQARALADLILYYNWTYISTVYTEGNYGFSGMQEFTDLITTAGVCEATADSVSNNANDAAYDQVIENLQKTPNARVVVCFCEGMTVRRLLEATRRKNAVGKFLFIGSDGWAVRPDVVDGLEQEAAGGISIKLYSPPIVGFDRYYFSLRPKTNTRNPWFREFWQQKFECYIDGPDKDRSFETPCTGEEDLSKDYVQDAKLGFVVNAIYSMAYALDKMQRHLCTGQKGLCPAMMPLNGTLFLEYLLNVSFSSYSGDVIVFNRNGDPPGRYDIMNFQKLITDNGSVYYDYVRIGGWKQGNLTMDDSKIYWPSHAAASWAPMVESVCSKPCPKGQVKKIQQGGVPCCWVCTSCQDHEFMLDNATCKACPLGWWPNKDLTACLMIDIEHIKWGDREAVVAMGFACVGIVATLWVALVFVRHNNTAVVKASTRELSYIILLGIAISYCTTFPLVAKPSLLTCYLARILPGFSFSLIYGALVTKTNRIARILAGSKKKIITRKPRFMSASAQVVITCIIIGIECAIITVMLILEPADSKLIYPKKTRVKLTCNATTLGILVPLGFDIFLIVMCTLYAIKTRNLPENFNEAKFIGFTMYTTCIVWLAFVPIYFGSDNKVLTMCLAITLSASVALILLFFRKIYIIVCKPEKNNRSAFTTTKDVRCHIGSAGTRDSMEKNEKTFATAAMMVYRQKNFFERWKNKSSSGNETPTTMMGRMAVATRSNHQTSPQIRPAVASNKTGTLEAFTTKSKTATSGFSRPPVKPRFFCGLLTETSAEIVPTTTTKPSTIDRVGRQSSRRKVSGDKRLKERSVQTGDDLLQPLLSGLRRRVKAGVDYSDGPSAGTEHIEALLDAAARGDAEETEISPLLLTPQPVPTRPLPPGNERRDGDSSTSEETLSEREMSDSDDIEELLATACPGEASFGSDSEHSPTTPTNRSGYKYQACPLADDDVIIHVCPPPGRSVVTVPVAGDGLLVGHTNNFRVTNSTRDNLDVPAAGPSRIEYTQDMPASRPSRTEDTLDVPAASRNKPVWSHSGADNAAADCVLNNSRSPNVRRHRSLQPERGSRSPRQTRRQTSLHVPGHVNYSMDDNTGTHIPLKVKVTHVRNRRSIDAPTKQDENVVRFQKYLKTKGIELDLNSVQTSNV